MYAEIQEQNNKGFRTIKPLMLRIMKRANAYRPGGASFLQSSMNGIHK
jgi:hypothetical protein